VYKLMFCTFIHIKSPVKNLHGRAKGGASHRAPLKYATVQDTLNC